MLNTDEREEHITNNDLFQPSQNDDLDTEVQTMNMNVDQNRSAQVWNQKFATQQHKSGYSQYSDKKGYNSGLCPSANDKTRSQTYKMEKQLYTQEKSDYRTNFNFNNHEQLINQAHNDFEGKETPMKSIYASDICSAQKHAQSELQNNVKSIKSLFNNSCNKNNINLQQSSTNSDAEQLVVADLSVTPQNSNTMQFQQRNNKIKDISTHLSGPTFQVSQAKNLAQQQAQAGYSKQEQLCWYKQQLKPKHDLKNPENSIIKVHHEPHLGQDLNLMQVQKIKLISNKQITEKRKKFAHRQRYLNLFTDQTDQKKRMKYLVSDLKKKSTHQFKKCQKPLKEKKLLILTPQTTNVYTQKIQKAKLALKRFSFKQQMRKRNKKVEEPKQQGEYEPNDISMSDNTGVNVVISHIEKFINRKKEQNQAKLSGNVFSFLDVQSLWQDSDISSKIQNYRREQLQKLQQNSVQIKEPSISSLNNWSIGSGSDDDYEVLNQRNQTQPSSKQHQILVDTFLLNDQLLEKQELEQYKLHTVPEVNIQENNFDIDFCSQSDMKTKIASQSTAIDSNFKTVLNRDQISFSNIKINYLFNEGEDETLTPIRPSSRPSSIQYRMSSINQSETIDQ